MITTPYAIDLAGEMIRHQRTRLGWTTAFLTLSTTGLLCELLVAGSQVGSVLSEASFGELNDQVIEQVLADPGLGDKVSRGILRNTLPRKSDNFVPNSHKYRAIENLMPGLERDYLSNWLTEFRRPEYAQMNFPDAGSIISPATSAALLSAFLLAAGLSSELIIKWLDYSLKYAPDPISLEDLIQMLIERYKRGNSPLEIMVLLDRPVAPASRSIEGWLNAAEAKSWLNSNGFSFPRTVHGGILYRSDQWDIYGALKDVSSSLQRIRYRATLKTGKPPSFYPKAWIKGVKTARDIPDPTVTEVEMPGYPLENPSLVRPSSENRLEVAVEFIQAASLGGGPGSAGMLWAALESLLSAPGDPDRMEVVNRGADIGLIAVIRSQINTSLALLLERRADSEDLRREITALPYDERFDRLQMALVNKEYEALQSAGARLQISHTADLLSVERIKALRLALRHSLSGLYRQRNLVLHGGITDGPLLKGYLRIGFQLVPAIINRYARAWEDTKVDPQVFAFQANAAVEEHIQRSTNVFDFMR
jgi:hypothetical protein